MKFKHQTKKNFLAISLFALTLASCQPRLSSGVLSSEDPESSSSVVSSSNPSEESSLSSSSNSSSSASSSSATSSVSSSTSSSAGSSSSSSSSAVTPTVYDSMAYGSYYASVDFTKTKASLKTALSSAISAHTSLGYDNLKNYYPNTDQRSDGSVWDMYSNHKFSWSQNSGNYSKEGDIWNKEHTVPQSVFNEANPMVCDLYHVYPTDGYVNNRRSNYPHAMVSGTPVFSSSNDTIVGNSATSGVSGRVCEPADEYKGDFARTYFYMVTCYESRLSSWKSFATFTNNSYPSLSSWAITLYKQWSHDDPVSEKETKRTAAVFACQKNRNPYIDYPGLENLVWPA